MILKAEKLVASIFIFSYFFIIHTVTLYAENLPYDFIENIEITKENCPVGENCLLSPYLKVALFSDRKIAGRQVGVLLDDYFYCHDQTGNVYRAPVGFETDFLSIPELAQLAIRSKDFMEAGVIHDWLYAVGIPGKKKVADKIFHHILIEQGAGLVKRNAMYKAVRWFGKSSYGARPEIPILDLITMEKISPSPVAKPKTTIIANINCSDENAFKRISKENKSKYYYKQKVNNFFKHEGFVKEEK